MLALNLFHEQQELQRARDFDPVRLTLVGGALILTIIFTYGSVMYLKMGTLRNKLSQSKIEDKKLDDEIKALGALTDLPKIQSQAGSLENRIQHRILFATQLDILQQTVPTNVQVRAFRTTRSMKTSEVTMQGRKGPYTVKKISPALDISLEIQARGKDKIGILQLRDNLTDILRQSPGLRDWLPQLPDENGKGMVNEIHLDSSIVQDPKPGEPAVGLFIYKLPIALKDEPKDL